METKSDQTRFVQESPQLGNQFLEDSALLDYMHFLMPQEVIEQAQPDLVRLGHRAVTDIMDFARDADRNQPKHESFDAWGKRIDVIHTTSGWKELKKVSAEEGIVAFAYENHYGIHRRLLQAIRLYIFSPSSSLFNCPLAMTDGAAFMLRNMLQREGSTMDPAAKKKAEKALAHLTSRDPNKFWTSGQWMTERRGGSDVSGATETVAVKNQGKGYRLYGDKWFTSATDSEMCVTLARVKDNAQIDRKDTQIPLSLFFMKIRNKDGNLNGIQIRRLKDKMGTRQLPTAELELQGSKATLLSPEGKGVKYISDMLNITRLYNAVAGVGAMRRMIALARDWSQRREAWGKKISDLPLQNQVLMQMDLTFRGSLMFTLSMASILGKIEERKATADEENIYRILVPVLKLFVAKESVKLCSEGLECFGGQGYIESSGIPVIFRDVHVTTIWEGTTNVLCYDFIRALSLGKIDRLESFGRYFRESISKIMQSDSNLTSVYREFREAGLSLIESFNELYSDLHTIVSNPKSLPSYECNLREITFGIARIYIATQLGLCAIRNGTTKDVYIFVQWVNSYAPYKKYLAFKGKLQLSSKLLKDVAQDNDSKDRFEYLRKNVDPKLFIRPKF